MVVVFRSGTILRFPVEKFEVGQATGHLQALIWTVPEDYVTRPHYIDLNDVVAVYGERMP